MYVSIDIHPGLVLPALSAHSLALGLAGFDEHVPLREGLAAAALDRIRRHLADVVHEEDAGREQGGDVDAPADLDDDGRGGAIHGDPRAARPA